MCYESGCSAVGSARGLGACDRLVSRPPKARKISVFLAFSRFSAVVCFGEKLLTTDLTTYGFDRKNWISGCRVTVTRLLWERVTASWADRRKLAKSPFFSCFLAFPSPCVSAKNFWPQIWPLTDLTEKLNIIRLSGCGAAGSARSLGLRCRRFESGHSDQKSVENKVFSPHFRLIFLLIIGFYPPLRQIRLTAETRLVP